MKQQAEGIVERSALSEESKALWYAVIDVNDPSFAEEFVQSVGDDAETLSIATDLLHARKNAGTALEPGRISPNEEQYLYDLVNNASKN